MKEWDFSRMGDKGNSQEGEKLALPGRSVESIGNGGREGRQAPVGGLMWNWG